MPFDRMDCARTRIARRGSKEPKFEKTEGKKRQQRCYPQPPFHPPPDFSRHDILGRLSWWSFSYQAKPAMSPIGRFCCKSRKSNNAENLAKAIFEAAPPLQSAVAPIRRSVVVFLRNDEVPRVERRETHQRL